MKIPGEQLLHLGRCNNFKVQHKFSSKHFVFYFLLHKRGKREEAYIVEKFPTCTMVNFSFY